MSRVFNAAQRLAWMEPSRRTPTDQTPNPRKNRTFSSLASLVVQAKADKKMAALFPPSKRSWLAQYLLLLAKLGADIPGDDHARLLRANLHREPPMHPRRTLDQYYFSTLKDTTPRDKDQVVYRETKTKPGENKHNHDPSIVMVDQLWLWILDDSVSGKALSPRHSC